MLGRVELLRLDLVRQSIVFQRQLNGFAEIAGRLDVALRLRDSPLNSGILQPARVSADLNYHGGQSLLKGTIAFRLAIVRNGYILAIQSSNLQGQAGM